MDTKKHNAVLAGSKVCVEGAKRNHTTIRLGVEYRHDQPVRLHRQGDLTQIEWTTPNCGKVRFNLSTSELRAFLADS